MSNLTSSKTKRTNTPSAALDQIEVAIRTTTEQHPTSSTEDDDSSTIMSKSEQTPEIVGHTSKVSLLGHPRAFYKPSLLSFRIPQAQTSVTLFEAD